VHIEALTSLTHSTRSAMQRFALTVATASLMIASALMAATSTIALNAQVQIRQDQQAQSQPRQAPQAKSFAGTISKEGDSFMLRDDAGKSSYRVPHRRPADSQQV
jgi:hypothetical protein